MDELDFSKQDVQLTNRQWWASKRSKYNKGLVIAGITAFITYAIIGSYLYSDNSDFEITIFTIAFQ